MSYTNSDRTLVSLILATWAKASGLTQAEARQLSEILWTQSLPWSVDVAWTQLEAATLAIRQNRREPPLQQAPIPWADQ